MASLDDGPFDDFTDIQSVTDDSDSELDSSGDLSMPQAVTDAFSTPVYQPRPVPFRPMLSRPMIPDDEDDAPQDALHQRPVPIFGLKYGEVDEACVYPAVRDMFDGDEIVTAVLDYLKVFSRGDPAEIEVITDNTATHLPRLAAHIDTINERYHAAMKDPEMLVRHIENYALAVFWLMEQLCSVEEPSKQTAATITEVCVEIVEAIAAPSGDFESIMALGSPEFTTTQFRNDPFAVLELRMSWLALALRLLVTLEAPLPHTLLSSLASHLAAIYGAHLVKKPIDRYRRCFAAEVRWNHSEDMLDQPCFTTFCYTVRATLFKQVLALARFGPDPMKAITPLTPYWTSSFIEPYVALLPTLATKDVRRVIGLLLDKAIPSRLISAVIQYKIPEVERVMVKGRLVQVLFVFSIFGPPPIRRQACRALGMMAKPVKVFGIAVVPGDKTEYIAPRTVGIVNLPKGRRGVLTGIAETDRVRLVGMIPEKDKIVRRAKAGL